ncbi:hypothetical protein JB92DRAFT_2825350 [Gautieria morchelliformis]|nr:hypothetical protein JB92DRAFT_2825350 [Gautieria morchelliformis]
MAIAGRQNGTADDNETIDNETIWLVTAEATLTVLYGLKCAARNAHITQSGVFQWFKTFRGSKDAIHEYPVYNELLFELACVQRLASFTEEFFEEVRGQGIEVEAFTVTEAFIIQVVQETAEDINRAYLVEPLRSSTATIKFSGTLTNRVASGRRAAGVGAFAH